MSPTPTPWLIHCPTHGRVFLTEAEYSEQLDLADDGWRCTRLVRFEATTTPDSETVAPCGALCEWDDLHHERTVEAWEQGR